MPPTRANLTYMAGARGQRLQSRHQITTNVNFVPKQPDFKTASKRHKTKRVSPPWRLTRSGIPAGGRVREVRAKLKA